jgi:hypothetical protein
LSYLKYRKVNFFAIARKPAASDAGHQLWGCAYLKLWGGVHGTRVSISDFPKCPVFGASYGVD